jgi:hypothetical protein
MVVCNLDFESIIRVPREVDPPLFVDSDGVLPVTISPESLQPVAGRSTEILQGLGIVQHPKFAQSDGLHVSGKPTYSLATVYALRVFIRKRFDHYLSI